MNWRQEPACEGRGELVTLARDLERGDAADVARFLGANSGGAEAADQGGGDRKREIVLHSFLFFFENVKTFSCGVFVLRFWVPKNRALSFLV